MKALILVDYENEWIDPGSGYFVGDISAQLTKTNLLINWARKNDFKIIFTLHEELESDQEFKPNSYRTQLIDAISKQESDLIIIKNKISPFYQTNLDTHLEDVEEIVVAGILTNLCVRSLVSDAYDRGFSITVVEDCCVALDPQTHDFTIKDLKETRPEVSFVKVEALV